MRLLPPAAMPPPTRSNFRSIVPAIAGNGIFRVCLLGFVATEVKAQKKGHVQLGTFWRWGDEAGAGNYRRLGFGS